MAFDPNSPAASHEGLADITAIRTNFNALRNCEASATEPSNLVAGMLWYDTATLALKLRKAASWEGMPFLPGTVMVFFQAAAPVGWTQNTSHNDKMLRVVSGAGGGSGGNVSAISHTHTGPSHTHTGPSHTHDMVGGTGTVAYIDIAGSQWLTTTSAAGTGATGAEGTGATGAATPYYIDTIIATKN